jgi:hypothetical protein
MTELLVQTSGDLSAIDKWGFAGLGVLLTAYILWMNRLMLERIGPMLEKTNGILERTSLILERVANLLDDIERKHQ